MAIPRNILQNWNVLVVDDEPDSLEVATRLSQSGKKPRRRIVFMAFTGEERGLLGSAYYVKNPRLPLESQSGRPIASRSFLVRRISHPRRSPACEWYANNAAVRRFTNGLTQKAQPEVAPFALGSF